MANEMNSGLGTPPDWLCGRNNHPNSNVPPLVLTSPRAIAERQRLIDNLLTPQSGHIGPGQSPVRSHAIIASAYYILMNEITHRNIHPDQITFHFIAMLMQDFRRAYRTLDWELGENSWETARRDLNNIFMGARVGTLTSSGIFGIQENANVPVWRPGEAETTGAYYNAATARPELNLTVIAIATSVRHEFRWRQLRNYRNAVVYGFAHYQRTYGHPSQGADEHFMTDEDLRRTGRMMSNFFMGFDFHALTGGPIHPNPAPPLVIHRVPTVPTPNRRHHGALGRGPGAAVPPAAAAAGAIAGGMRVRGGGDEDAASTGARQSEENPATTARQSEEDQATAVREGTTGSGGASAGAPGAGSAVAPGLGLRRAAASNARRPTLMRTGEFEVEDYGEEIASDHDLLTPRGDLPRFQGFRSIPLRAAAPLAAAAGDRPLSNHGEQVTPSPYANTMRGNSIYVPSLGRRVPESRLADMVTLFEHMENTLQEVEDQFGPGLGPLYGPPFHPSAFTPRIFLSDEDYARSLMWNQCQEEDTPAPQTKKQKQEEGKTPRE